MFWPFTLFKRNKPKVKNWNKKDITYCFLDRHEIRAGVWKKPVLYYKDLINKCAQEWSCTDINLELREYSEVPQPDIVISVQDLEKGMLGWAYFPSHKPIGGDIALDEDVFESAELLRKVVLHEFGHALGLPHSRYKSSIMYKHPRVCEVTYDAIQDINEAYRGVE